ncbi:MAG TPA: division/cell wall cluster transcriptional repressor MraZ [Ferruginibacter sp.]|nr:division/cell wall cluster transcriptional repressor MraZ [Ferruginibacter sp.]
MGIIGVYESTVDQKGRFLLPAGYKKQLPEEESHTFILTQGFEKCLRLFTKKAWEPQFQKVSQLNDAYPKVRQLQRLFLQGTTYVEPDGAGRMLIPKNLLEYASLKKDIILIPTSTCYEIWEQSAYNAVLALGANIEESGLTDQGYSQLAEEVFNDPKYYNNFTR